MLPDVVFLVNKDYHKRIGCPAGNNKREKRKFLQKFRTSSNELCVIFRDQATADLELQ